MNQTSEEQVGGEEIGERSIWKMSGKGEKCLCCDGGHELIHCKQFPKFGPKVLKQFFRVNWRCYNCFQGHFLNKCPVKSKCTLETCKWPNKHHVKMHHKPMEKRENETAVQNNVIEISDGVENTVNTTASARGEGKIMMAVVPIRLTNPVSKKSIST